MKIIHVFKKDVKDDSMSENLKTFWYYRLKIDRDFNESHPLSEKKVEHLDISVIDDSRMSLSLDFTECLERIHGHRMSHNVVFNVGCTCAYIWTEDKRFSVPENTITLELVV